MATEVSKGYLTPEGGFTIECWFWRDAIPVTYGTFLFAQRDQGLCQWNVLGVNGRQFSFGFTMDHPPNGTFNLISGNTGGTNVFEWTDASPTGYQGDSQWHHVAVTLDAATMKVYKIFLDGELYSTQTLTNPVVWNTGMCSIAGALFPSRSEPGQYAYDKRLAYFAMYDRELTANRIQEHYTAGSGGTVYYADDEVERLNRILDWSGVPENARILDPAVSELQGIQVADTNALTQAQETAEWAGGYIFANGQAAIEYHNRKHRYNRLHRFMVSESDGSAPEVGITFSTNEAFIFNDIRGTRPFGSQVRLQSYASQDTHGRKVTSINLHITDPNELQSAVSWMLARYGADRIRVSEVKFSCGTSRNLLRLAYSHIDIGDMFIIDELTDPAPSSRMEFTIEGISINTDWLNKKWIVSLQLTPNELNRVFQVGESALGGTDYIAY